MDLSLNAKTNVYTPPAELEFKGIDLSRSGINNSVCEGGFLSFCEDVEVQYRGNFTNVEINNVKVEVNIHSKNVADSHDDNSTGKTDTEIGHGTMGTIKFDNSGKSSGYGGGRYGFAERQYLPPKSNQQ